MALFNSDQKSARYLVASIVIVALDFTLKWSIIKFAPELWVLNPSGAFGLSIPGRTVLAVVLLATLLALDQKRSLYIWLSLLIAISSNIVDRVLVQGVIDYIRVGPLQLNLSDILICFLIATIGFNQLRGQKRTTD